MGTRTADPGGRTAARGGRTARERTRPTPAANIALIAFGAAIVLGIVVFVFVILSGGYQDENSVTATVFSPMVLIGGLPVAVFVITWVVVALRRRTTK